jgi:pentatricopeptide repeat protein
MREKGVIPDRKHYAMAMFACVTSNQCGLAESVFAMYVRMGEKPDVALYTLFLRALLQQGKWQEGMLLFRRMLNGKEIAGRPNHHTLNCLLQV